MTNVMLMTGTRSPLQLLSYPSKHGGGGHQLGGYQEMKILGHEMTTLASFDTELSPENAPEEIEVTKIKKDLEKYRSSRRFESKDGLDNHFQVKHW